MYRRMLAAAFAAMLIPAAAAAQFQPLQEDLTSPRYRITPFIGVLTSFDRVEEWQFNDAGNVTHAGVSHHAARGTAVGLNVELPLSGRYGIIAAGAFASRDRSFLELSTGELFQIDGNNVFLGRLGAVLHLREEPSEFVLRRLNASLFAGGTVMHERPRNSLGTADFASSGTHFGLNVGGNAELPFANDRFALQVGIEDNIMFWRDAPFVSTAAEYFAAPESQVTVSADMTHTWLLRAGFSMRVR